MKWVRQRCQLAPANTAAMLLLRRLQPLVSVGGCQFHPVEPSSHRRPEVGQPVTLAERSVAPTSMRRISRDWGPPITGLKAEDG